MIFMTSYVDNKTRLAAMAGGAVAFLAKPVEINRLIDFMRLALTHSKAAVTPLSRVFYQTGAAKMAVVCGQRTWVR
ncbi:hypothetical protein [Phyllobacterium zundukense]|uniref:hypothetical protein n=1 Tax=Phyllobacterium zundukense TaxID=1867719 RepID=UPI003965BEF5